MGYAISWLAFSGADQNAVLQRLGVSETNKSGRIGESKFLGGSLRTGWYLIVARGCDHALIGDVALASISQDRAVVACSIEEHVMLFSCASWQDGHRKWSLLHRGDESLSHLDVTGSPPPELAALRAEAAAKQEAETDEATTVDWYFELLADLAKRITGFRHDEETPEVDHAALKLMNLANDGLLSRTIKPWWKLW